jgi:shikimate kinase
MVVSPLGFEPRTQGLKVPRSATELRAHAPRTIPGRRHARRAGTRGRSGPPAPEACPDAAILAVMTRPDDPGWRRLLLVGMMGSGKTTIGRAVAARLGWPYLDNDELVREIAGVDAPTLATTRGADRLHEVELDALDRVLEDPGPLVAALAGYVVTDPGAVLRLRERAVVAWLRARPEMLRARIGDGAGRRDDARSEAWLAQVAADRAGAYAAVADIVVDVDDRTVEEIAAQIVAALAAPGEPGPA